MPGCSCCTQKQPYLSFHSFLVGTAVKKKQIQVIRRQEVLNLHLCNRHKCNKQRRLFQWLHNQLSKKQCCPKPFPLKKFYSTTEKQSLYEMTNKRQSASSQPGEGSDMAATAVKLDHDCAIHPSAGKLLPHGYQVVQCVW